MNLCWSSPIGSTDDLVTRGAWIRTAASSKSQKDFPERRSAWLPWTLHRPACGVQRGFRGPFTDPHVVFGRGNADPDGPWRTAHRVGPTRRSSPHESWVQAGL